MNSALEAIVWVALLAVLVFGTAFCDRARSMQTRGLCGTPFFSEAKCQ